MMRIRKHFTLSSSSSFFSRLPLSTDPQLIRRSSVVVVVQPQYPNINNPDVDHYRRLSSDPHHQPPIHHHTKTTSSQQTLIRRTEIPALVCARNNKRSSITSITQRRADVENKHKEMIIKDERWKTKEEEMKISNDIRKESISSAEVVVQFPQSSSSSSSCQALDKCGEGDRIVPPKKRKIGSFARSILGNTNTSKEIMMIKPKMKSKTNKKCLQQNGTGADHDEELVTHYNYNKLEDNDHNTKNKKARSANSTKKRKRGSVIMEGSRCSRVNGRGWRCWQQTLVGYSLCEHHLGKGRLRSMTSCARNRDITTAAAAVSAATFTTVNQQEGDDDDDQFVNSIMNIVAPEEDGRENTLINRMSKKKRKMVKIGSVKARSISSLLGQGDNF